MKVIIMTDLEGISLVDSIDMIPEGNEGYRFACERLMADVNAAVQGAVDAGADEILVFDGHGGGNNFIDGMLDPRATHCTDYNAKGLFDGCCAYLEIGTHAKAGTMCAFLDHTQSSKTWFNYYINGETQGELAQGAAYCGEYGVPTVMVSGDEAACAQARELIEGIECAVVKRAEERNRAVCIDGAEAEQRIREAACRGIMKAASIKPYTVSLPAEIKVEFCRADYADDHMKYFPYLKRIDARTVSRVVDKIETFNDVLLG